MPQRREQNQGTEHVPDEHEVEDHAHVGLELAPKTRLSRVASLFAEGLKGQDAMNTLKILAIVLIVAGGLGLAYGSFSYTEETHKVTLGQIELSVKGKETVNVPVWAGAGAIVIGSLLLLFASKRS